MNAEENRVDEKLLLLLMQPIPPVASSSESDSSDSDSVVSNSDSDHHRLSEDEKEDLDVTDFHEGGPANEDILFPFFQILMRGRRKANVQDFIATVHQKTDEEFRQTFRLTRRLAYKMIGQLEMSGFIPDHKSGGRPKKSAEVSFLMFLWYVGNDGPLRILANNFDMSESSVFRIIRRVVDWLMTLLDYSVVWPVGEEVHRVASAFADYGGIQNCIGAISGCHIGIIKPPLPNAEEYCCEKKFHSIHLTAVVNAQRKFTMVYCGDPGSFHDAEVLRHSNFYQVAQERTEEIFPRGTFVVGDGRYQGVSDVWLVCPYRDNGRLTEDQMFFNQKLFLMMAFVEQAFGILKGRFHRLLRKMYLLDVPFAVDLITVCCILHNLCINEGDFGLDMEDPDWQHYQPHPRAEDRSWNIVQLSKREILFTEIFGYCNDCEMDEFDNRDSNSEQ